MGQNCFRLQRCQPVTSLRAVKPDTRNKFSAWRCVFTLLVCWATGSSGYNQYFPTATQYYFKCGEEVWFCPESCGRQEGGAIFPTMCQHRCSIYTRGLWIIWKTLWIGKKDVEANSSAHWQQKFGLSWLVSCFQQACAIGFSHTNARKRYKVDSKKRRTVSQLQTKEASLMSYDFRLCGFQYPNCKPNSVGTTILVENPIVWVLPFQMKTRLIKFK